MGRCGKFFKIMFSEWGAGLSGPASVPFAILALLAAGAAQKFAYGLLAIILGFFSAYRVWAKENDRCQIAEDELEELRRRPPEIELTIENIVMHRTGDEEWRWKNGEFLVQVSSELLNLPSSSVEYSAQLVFRGEVIHLTAIKDVGKWEIIERKYYRQSYPNTTIMSRPRKDFVTNPAAITENLTRSIRNEGWLHFQIEGMGETDIAKRTLRLYAVSKNGGCHFDEQLDKHHVVRFDLVAMRKYVPKPL